MKFRKFKMEDILKFGTTLSGVYYQTLLHPTNRYFNEKYRDIILFYNTIRNKK